MRKPVFLDENVEVMSRLLAKALNRSREDRYVHFEYKTTMGNTIGEVFTGHNKIHWVFTTINGVDFSNDPLGIRKGTWKLNPQKGQHFYLMKTDFDKKARENWIIADFNLPKPAPAASVRPLPAGDGKTVPEEKRKLLQFLKYLHDKKLISREEYEREKKELLKKQ